MSLPLGVLAQAPDDTVQYLGGSGTGSAFERPEPESRDAAEQVMTVVP